ncbi:zinc finger protein 511-like [Littorina saxatilis]|uniref:C2H2-type domain-containing protein n=1 Tax=Littorina saxatilis TaxID=31220 RepID=A0AAN9BHK8_9CAEN
MDEGDSSSGTVKISLPWQWRPVKRNMLPGCDLFLDGDSALHTARKLVPLENDNDGGDVHILKQTIPCGVVGCKQTFTSLLSYENHYNSVHRHTCITCHRNFPSSYLLEIHIQENHDPLFSILTARQSMYQCLVESCHEKFSTPDERRHHLIKAHHYPANFRFHRLQPTSGKNQKSKSKANTDKMEIDKPTERNTTDTREATHAKSDTHISSTHTSSEISNHSASDTSRPGSSSERENTGSADVVQQLEGSGEEATPGMEVCEAEKASAPRRVFVHKVPQNFSFGHGVSRGFQRPPGKRGKKRGAHWHQRVADGAGETTTNIENMNMTDMAEALSDAV